MTRYLEDLRKHLQKQKMSPSDIDEIISDFTGLLEEAIEEGLDPKDLINQFGDPKKVAEELKQDTSETPLLDAISFQDWYRPEEGYDVSIHLLNEDIEVSLHDQPTIEVILMSAKDMKHYDIKFENNKLEIERQKNLSAWSFIIRREPKVRLLLKLPSLIGASTFFLKNVSGDMHFRDVDVKHLNIQTTNGDFDLKRSVLDSYKHHSVNGDLELTDVETRRADVSTVSGDIQIENAKITGDLNLHTVNGDVKLEEIQTETLDFHTVNGDLKGKEVYPKMLKFASINGDFKLKNKVLSDIKVIKQSTITGDLKISH